MTTPGPISDPAPVPAKAVAGRFGGAQAKNYAGAPAGDNEQGFGEVMSKLQGQEKPAAVKDAATQSANRRRDVSKAELAEDENGGNVRVGSDTELDFAADLDPLIGGEDAHGAPQSADAAAPPPVAANDIAIKDLAALVAVIPAQPAPANAVDAPKQPSSAGATDPAAKTRAILDAMSAATDDPAPLPESVPGGQPSEADVEVAKTPTPTGAATVATQGAAVAVGTKDKLQQVQNGRDPATAEISHDGASPVQTDEKPRQSNDTKANVVQQETHFAPVARTAPEPQADASAGDGGQPVFGGEAPVADPASVSSTATQPPSAQGTLPSAMSPASQIADRIAQAVPASTFADQLAGTPEMPAAKSPFKVLSIQLQPADLGTVTVRMELKDGELSLHVEADRADTADLIRGDQDTLSNLLRGAGYSVDAGSIKVVEGGDRTLVTQTAGQQGTQTNLQSSPQWQSGSSERQGQQGHRGGQAATNGGEQAPPSSRNESNETATNSSGRGLYI